ncbi:MAG: GNAT family N-acetyltransferase [Pseudomonadota bacterium]|nr:GNAT family N-acetyltransferase [Pseudomonadota bacterium]
MRLSSPSSEATAAPGGGRFGVRAVTGDNIDELLELEVAFGQRGLVGRVSKSIAQAAYEPAATPWGLYEGDTPVGLLLLYDMRKHAEKPRSELYVWRVLIDARHQRRGLGTRALRWAIEEARRWEVDAVGLSHQPLSGHAGPFYLKLGFHYTGEVDGDERKMIFPLT